MVVPSRHANIEQGACASETTADTQHGPSSEAEAISVDSGGPANTALNLRERLQYEIDNIRANASTWKGARRDVRFSTKLMVWLVKGML